MTTERERFEAAMRARVNARAQPGEFDEMADFWFDRIEDGRYELARMEDAWTGWQMRAALAQPAAQGEPHTDDVAVDRLAAAMKAKLARARAKGRSGWDDKDACTGAYLRQLLREHLHKGDPVDVANFACFLFNRGESTGTALDAAPQPAPMPGEAWIASKDGHKTFHFSRVDGWEVHTVVGEAQPAAQGEPPFKTDMIGVCWQCGGRLLAGHACAALAQPAAQGEPAAWCHPRDRDRQTWIIIFDDEDRPRCVYHDAVEARAAFDRAESMGWNCHLFVSVRRDAAPQPAAHGEPVAWRAIDTAPKGRIILVFYKNSLGNGRTMRARYYLPDTLESDVTDSGFADEGWYEESEAYEYLMPLEHEPTHWMPMPAAPDAAQQPAPQPAARGEPFVWAWRGKQMARWIFDPSHEWREEHKDDPAIEWLPLYAAPQPAPVEWRASDEETEIPRAMTDAARSYADEDNNADPQPAPAPPAVVDALEAVAKTCETKVRITIPELPSGIEWDKAVDECVRVIRSAALAAQEKPNV